MKNYLKTGLYTFIIICVLYAYLHYNNLLIGNDISDFGKQHLKFIEYLRAYILNTGDLAPQLNMNYGLGQSFVTMYYHGMYNPYILLSLILGDVPIYTVMTFIYTILLLSSSLAMHLLARLNNFTHKQARTIALLTTFSGGILFHIACHVMFIYYYPFMILSLIALHYMADDRNYIIYTFCLTMVFYTNFFFAPIVSIIQFLYYVGLLVNKNKLSIAYISKFAKAYLLGVLMGSLILVPVVMFISGGVRGGNSVFEPKLFSDFNVVIAELVYYPYYLGIGIIPLLTSIYGLFRVKEKNLWLPIFGFILMVSFEKIIFLLNLNMYNELKHSIYFIPIIFLILGKYLFDENKINRLILPIIISIFLILLANKVPVVDKSFLIIEILIILLIALSPVFKKYQLIFVVIFIGLTLDGSLLTIKEEDYEKLTINKEDSLKYNADAIKPYRALQNGLNELKSLGTFNPNIYTSLENMEYEKLINEVLEIELADPVRMHEDSIFDNYLMRNFLAIETRNSKKNNEQVTPMVYGVANNATTNIENLRNMAKEDRIYAVNEAVFTEDSKNDFELKAKPSLIYASSEEFTAKDIKKYQKLAIPKKLQQNGTLIISFKTDIDAKNVENEKITINNHTNKIMMNDYYGSNPNREVTFLIDTNEKMKNLDIAVDTSENYKDPFVYGDLKVKFYDQKSLEQNKFTLYKPENFEVDLGHSYKFNINQKKAGYLNTTIPYDEGFKIYIDGKKVNNEKMDGLFLGAELSRGMHEVEITYEMKGFKIGLSLSLVAVLIYIRSRKKNQVINKRDK